MSSSTADTSPSLPQETDPRFFLAVQYVLGELSGTEQDAFETALPDDPALCALVAEASRLVCGVRQIVSDTESRPSITPVQHSFTVPPKRDRWTVAALTAAASLLAAVWLGHFSPSTPSSAAIRSSQAVELVSLWRNAGPSVGGSVTAEAMFDADGLATVQDDHVPPWMLAAVSLEKRHTATSLPESTEVWEDN